MTERIVVVGASVAGVRAAQALRAAGFDGELVLTDAEPALPYDKPPLSKQILTGEWTPDEVTLASRQDLDDAAISLRLGVAARALDAQRRRIAWEDGSTLDYDRIVIATGVRPRPLPEALDSGQVHLIRTMNDAMTLRERLLTTSGRLVVIGGGFIGAEVVSSAASLGVSCTLVEALPAPLGRVLGTRAGALVERLHREHGVEVLTESVVESVGAATTGSQVTLADGRVLEADIVVAGLGCIPNTEWLAGSGVTVRDGVETDEFCRATGPAGVYAIGDVARWFDARHGLHRRTEHWTHAFQQAQLVAHNMMHPDDLRAGTKAPYFWSDQHGVKIQMVGHASPTAEVEIVRRATPAGDRDVAVYSCEGRFEAAVAFGRPAVVPALRRAWEQEATRPEVLELLTSA